MNDQLIQANDYAISLMKDKAEFQDKQIQTANQLEILAEKSNDPDTRQQIIKIKKKILEL